MQAQLTVGIGIAFAMSIACQLAFAQPRTETKKAIEGELAPTTKKGTDTKTLKKAAPTTPSAAAAVPPGFFWDSKELQCQIGTPTGLKKIVYRFHLVPSPNGDWSVLYEAKTEKAGTSVPWIADYNLYSIYYFFSYAGGVKPNKEGTELLNNEHRKTGELFSGNGYDPFSQMVMTVKAGGGAHGIQVTWPGSNQCVFS